MAVIFVTLFAFLIPVAFFLWREWKKDKARQAREGIAPRKKEPVSVPGAARAFAVLLFLAVPVYFASDATYSHFRPDDALLKVAFKHSGTRVADCDEAGFVRAEGDRYRRELKDTRQVKMDIAALAMCPRERNPVILELYVDGEKVLDKPYAPTGLKRDMASYVYDEFMLGPGEHSFRALLYDTGTKGAPAYTLEASATVKPGDVLVVWLDDKAGRLALD